MSAPTYPIRQNSAKGNPKPNTNIERTCHNCGASFIGLAAGKTGERGVWSQLGAWYCSIECTPRHLHAGLGIVEQPVSEVTAR